MDVWADLYIRVERRYRGNTEIYIRTLAPRHGPYDATTNYTWARGRSRWLGPQEAGSTPLKLELRRPSARKTTRRQYEPPPTPCGRGGETRLAQGEVARERGREEARENYLFLLHFIPRLVFILNWLNARFKVGSIVRGKREHDRSLSLLHSSSTRQFRGGRWPKYWLASAPVATLRTTT